MAEQNIENETLARALCAADPDGDAWEENAAYWRQFAANLLDGILSDPDALRTGSPSSAQAGSPEQQSPRDGDSEVSSRALRRAAHYFRDMSQETLTRRRVIETLDWMADEAAPVALSQPSTSA